jgi:thiol-disulfide isomerase/thioredoxin
MKFRPEKYMKSILIPFLFVSLTLNAQKTTTPVKTPDKVITPAKSDAKTDKTAKPADKVDNPAKKTTVAKKDSPEDLKNKTFGKTLKFKVNGAKDTTVFLANYYGNKLYYSDTAKTDAKGAFQFSTKKKFDSGLYAVVVSGKYFELVLNNENVYMESDKADMVNKVKVIDSKENNVFYEYIKFINDKKKIADDAREKLKGMKGDEPEAKKLKETLSGLDKEVRTYQQEIVKTSPDMLISKILNLSLDPEIPEAPKKENGSPVDSLFAYKYLKAHYFDNLDFSDDRLVRCPFFHNRMEHYFKNMIAQVPDTMIAESNRMIPKFEASKEQFKYVTHHLMYTTSQSKIMCMDAAFVNIINKYYKTGKAYWMTDEKLKDLVERSDAMEPILCGKQSHNLSLLDTTGKSWKRLSDLKTDYTILIFWDPECGHCKKEIPKFVEVFDKYKEKSVSVYSVSSDHNAKWKKFIKDNKMENFVNVGVPADVYQKDQKPAHEYVRQGFTDYVSLNYRNHFDIYSTPKIFLLDKNKKIIAKQIEAEQMDKILDYLIKNGGKF